jgi:hypothetical protein
MAKMTLEEDRLKALFKVLADETLARAIEEGEQSKTVPRHEVFELFRRSESQKNP